MNLQKYTFLYLLIIISGSLMAQKKADFIIVRNPTALRILNQYQMAPSKDHPINRSINVPLQILKRKVTLSDQLTQALKVKFLGNEFYLVLDENGQPVGSSLAGSITEERRCTIINDTIRIISNAVKLKSHLLTSLSLTETQGEVFVRLYKKNNFYALMKPGNVPEFYWSTLSPNSGWEKVEKTSQKVSVYSSQIEGQILGKFEEANELYQLFFKKFNAHYHRNIKVPQWQVDQKGGSISATLNGFNNTNLQESFSALANELGYLILGQPYIITQNDSIIVISRTGSR